MTALLLVFTLVVPDRAWSLAPSIKELDADMLLLQEVLTGYKLLANDDYYRHTEMIKALAVKFEECGIKPSLMWNKFHYINTSFYSDILMIPFYFTESKDSYDECRQKYVIICEPRQEEHLIHKDANILKRIPVPKGFKAKEYDNPFQGQNLLIIEERRVRLYHGTWRAFLIKAAKKGKKGQTLTASRKTAIVYTNEINREIMRGGYIDKGHAYQTLDELKESVAESGVDIPESENYGMGFGVVLKFWADKAFNSFTCKAYQGHFHEWNAPKGRSSLNWLTIRSKQDFVILAGITHKLSWMDDSWDGVEFLERPLTSEEIIDAMSKRGTPLYDLYKQNPINEMHILEYCA